MSPTASALCIPSNAATQNPTTLPSAPRCGRALAPPGGCLPPMPPSLDGLLAVWQHELAWVWACHQKALYRNSAVSSPRLALLSTSTLPTLPHHPGPRYTHGGKSWRRRLGRATLPPHHVAVRLGGWPAERPPYHRRSSYGAPASRANAPRGHATGWTSYSPLPPTTPPTLRPLCRRGGCDDAISMSVPSVAMDPNTCGHMEATWPTGKTHVLVGCHRAGRELGRALPVHVRVRAERGAGERRSSRHGQLRTPGMVARAQHERCGLAVTLMTTSPCSTR